VDSTVLEQPAAFIFRTEVCGVRNLLSYTRRLQGNDAWSGPMEKMALIRHATFSGGKMEF
jgi:hypothetical protein